MYSRSKRVRFKESTKISFHKPRRKKNVVKLKVCLVRRCSPPRGLQIVKQEHFRKLQLKRSEKYVDTIVQLKRSAKQSQNVVKPKVCLLRCSPPSPREREVVAPPRIGHRREDLGSTPPPPRSVQLELPSCRHLPVLGDFYGFYLWAVA